VFNRNNIGQFTAGSQGLLTIEERFWAKVDKSGECWNWLGGKYKPGYGKFWYQGKMESAHRMAYQLAVGSIDNGMFVCHRCDNPGCVNPDHLFLGTNQDNVNDAIGKDRHSRGTRNGRAKINAKDVLSIREMYATNNWSQSALAKMYGVGQTEISNIVIGKTWQSISQPEW
jgi:hypothetical protein